MSDFDSREDKCPKEPEDLVDPFADFDMVFVYTRADALSDGTLVDISEAAQQVGFRFPIACTDALWKDINNIPEEVAGYQTVEGRLWDVLYMGARAIRQSPEDGSELLYQLIMQMEAGEEEYTVKLVCGPGDSGEPVMTLMKPNED